MAAADILEQDSQLVARSQIGDKQAAALLIKKYMPLVRRRASYFYGPALEHDDLVQEGMIGLLKAIDGFDHERESSFAAYADKCVTSRLSTVVRRSLSGKHKPLSDYLPLPDIAAEEAVVLGDPAAYIIEREGEQELRNRIETLLSLFEQDALNMYLSGHSYQHISLRLNCSAKAVDNALQRARRKLRSV